jgi:hypothetical protein
LLQRSLTRKRAEIDKLLEDVKSAAQQLQQIQSDLKKTEDSPRNLRQHENIGLT